jgi:hypothetical protein
MNHLLVEIILVPQQTINKGKMPPNNLVFESEHEASGRTKPFRKLFSACRQSS